ncbi:hypothetical protein HDU77_005369 [Chytriomyces hyalinus]|nr:hypothetical protein HDU77_005369 [Chytriomyces hyalinus]
MSMKSGSIPPIESVRLNCRQAVIARVLVNNDVAKFAYFDPLDQLASKTMAEKNPSHHPELRALYVKSLEDGEDGELVIDLPESLTNVSSTSASISAAAANAFISFTITIEYELIDPQLGIHFVFPDLGVSSATPYLYTSNQMNSARYWTPCIDTAQQKTSFTLELMTPTTFIDHIPAYTSSKIHGRISNRKQSLSSRDGSTIKSEGDKENLNSNENDPDSSSASKHKTKASHHISDEVLALSNGALVNCFSPEGHDGWKVTRYSFDAGVHASQILIAVGVFDYAGFGEVVLEEKTSDIAKDASSATAASAEKGTAEGDAMDVDDAENGNASPTDGDKDGGEENLDAKEGAAEVSAPFLSESGVAGDGRKGIPKCEVFYPEGLAHEIQATIEFLPQAMEFYEQFTGLSYPFPSFKMVFLDNVVTPVILGAGIGIFGTHLLIDDDDIENVYDSRMRFSVALASQWFGQYVTHRNWMDVWLTIGLANYMAGLFIRKHLGNNEYRYRLNEDMKRVVTMDVGQLPLCPMEWLGTEAAADADILSTKYFYPEEESSSLRSEFLALKAPLVIGMLDQRLGKGNLQKAINKVMISTMSGELENGLSTYHWFKVCRKLSSNNELKNFWQQWIYGSGCPKFVLTFKFSRKKLVVEVTIKQENMSKHSSATKKFTGPFIVRVHEPKGIAYSHQIFIDEMEKVCEIPYHTKYKRAGQKLKKLQKLGYMSGAPDNAEEGEDDYGAEFQQAAPEKDSKSKPDLDEFDRRSLDWIRWDPDLDWLCIKVHDQLRSMWIEQLARDNDVVAHHEAIIRLGSLPSDISTTALMRVLMDERYFYRLRMEAAFSLAKIGIDPADGSGLTKMIAYFVDKYCYPKALNSAMIIPRPNDFRNLQNYFVKKALSAAIIAYRDAENRIPLQNKLIILDLLRFNDNSQNEFSDAYYIAVLINTLCHSTVPQKAQTQLPKIRDSSASYEGVVEMFDFVGGGSSDMNADDDIEFGSEQEKNLFWNAHSEVERYLALDRLIASHHNVVTRVCIEAIFKWTLAGLLPMNLPFFLNYSSFGNFYTVRLMAIDALIILDSLQTNDILCYLLKIVESDPDIRVAIYTAKEMYNLVALTKSLSPMETRGPDGKRLKQAWGTLKAKISQNTEFSANAWALLRSKTIDPRKRFYLLRLCELLYKPLMQTFTPKKLVIKMPSLNTSEMSDFYAEPKAIAKPQRSSAAKSAPKQPTFTEPFPAIDPQFLATGRHVIINLRNHTSSGAFQLPVEETIAPNYFAVIKRPMDISTCSKKLESGAYRNNLSLLFNDVALIFENCYSYNADDCPVVISARRLERYFNTEIMPRALVHELGILTTAIDIVDDPIPVPPSEPVSVPAKVYVNLSPPRTIVIPRAALLPPKPPVPALSSPKPTSPPLAKGATPQSSEPKLLPALSVSKSNQSSVESKPVIPTMGSKPVVPVSASKPSVPAETKTTITLPMKKAVPAPVGTKPIAAPPGTRPIPAPPGTRPVPAPPGTRQIPAPSGTKPIPAPPGTKPIPPASGTRTTTPLGVPSSVSTQLGSKPAPAAPKPSPPIISKVSSTPDKPALPRPILKLKAEEPTPVSSPQPSLPSNQKRKMSSGSPNVPPPNDSSQPLRLSSEDYKKCKKIIRRLLENPLSHWFHLPVDPIALGIPHYTQVIKEPMDFQTLKTKLSAGEFPTIRAFKSTAALIFKNAIAFNDATTQVHQDSLVMLQALKQECKQAFGDSKVEPARPEVKSAPVLGERDNGLSSGYVGPKGDPLPKKMKLKHDTFEVEKPAAPPVPASPAPVSVAPQLPAQKMAVTSASGKKCLKILRKLQTDRHGQIFSEPVDPVKLNIPTYFTVIKKPMDLRTISRKLESGTYRDHKDFRSDVELMLNNCFTFNVPGDWVFLQGKGLEAVFLAEWKQVNWDNLNAAKPPRQIIEEALAKLRKHPDALIFMEPVDPAVLPDYYQKIRNPIDFQTMGQKLDRGEYVALDEFEKDFKLLISNCFTYNPKKSFGHNAGLNVEKYFKQIWRR